MEKKKVLLIGDSIRINYCSRVKELLSDIADVYYTDTNNQWTAYAMWNVPFIVESMGVEQFDCIHWNTGAWDLHRHLLDGNFTPYEDYVKVNERMYRVMAHYGKHLIWATITPGGKQLDTQQRVADTGGTVYTMLTDRQEPWNADVRKYNAGASEMYRSHGVKINDLYSAIIKDTDRYLSDDGLHLSEAGIELAAGMVSGIIRETLTEP